MLTCIVAQNIVATGAGFVDGLGYGDNTKAAIIRLGMMEIIKFCEVTTTLSSFFILIDFRGNRIKNNTEIQ